MTEITYSINTERNGIEIRFPDKPEPEILAQLGKNGHKFRWSRAQGLWYGKNTPERLAFAQELADEQTEPETFEFPEIDIDDIETYTFSQSLIDREHDSHWIFRQEKRNHSKEIQDLFRECNQTAQEIIDKTEDKEIIYKVKRDLQYFKKHYFATEVTMLTSKANNPSWAVTGRSGRDMNKYNKVMDRQHDLMGKKIELHEEFERRMDRYRIADVRKKKKEVAAIAAQIEIDIEFKTMQKEFTFVGVKDKRRAYCYKDYWIVNCWGCFRIFKGETEIHSMKTKETLKDAKKYLTMIIHNSERGEN